MSALPERWVAVDFETANRDRASACALGLAVIEGDRIVAEHDWLIDPAADFEWWNTQVHGITAEDVAQSPEFDEVWAEAMAYVGDGSLLAHNAAFDMSVLRGSLDRYGMATPRLSYACTVAIARATWPRLANHRLDTVCRHCGIGLEHHVAASDARACAEVALSGCAAAGVSSVADLLTRSAIPLRPF